MSELSQRLSELLDASVAKCTEGQDVAIAFSGGIDSALVAALAKRHARSVSLYTVGAEGSHDVEAAREVAPLLGLDVTVIDLPDRDIVENLREMISVTGTESPLTLAFEMPLFCVMRNCSEGTILGGQGADELFAGYNKYVGMKDLQMRDEMAKDLAKLYTATKPHEAAMGKHFGKTVKYAYLDKDIVALSRNAPTEVLRPIDEDIRKKLLCDFIRGDMPQDVREEVSRLVGKTGDEIIDQVYTKPFPNRYCAQFCKYVGDNRHRNQYFHDLMLGAFKDFFKAIVSHYPEYAKYKLNCVGSVGYFYQDLLSEAAKEYGMELGAIMRAPMEGLIRYHISER